jgi:3'-phosphoadenosine 5'-phosphosulfate sulfotransferase (PAPS reductase)/FAD synthetase
MMLPRTISAEARARIKGKRVVASISGGKDSAALSLWLTENGIAHDRVFMDTGWEHRLTYEYMRGELARVIGPITEIRAVPPAPKPGEASRLSPESISLERPLLRAAVAAGNPMVLLLLRKQMFASRVLRFCTEKLKVIPIKAHLDRLMDGGEDVVSAVGIRAEESEARSKLAEWEWSESFDCDVWRPLISWPEDEVILIHKRHNLQPNPLYLQGASRVGCWPCIYARKAEIRMLAEDEERVTLIRELEAELTERARARAEAKGEELKWERTWFQQGSGRAEDELWPIDKAIDWSRTSRGGTQFEMFAAAGRDQGCMRWGLCDTGTKAKEEDAA